MNLMRFVKNLDEFEIKLKRLVTQILSLFYKIWINLDIIEMKSREEAGPCHFFLILS